MNTEVTVRSADLIRRLDIYDGPEQELYQTELEIPGSGGIVFKGGQLLSHRFQELKSILGEEVFDRIVEEQGYLIPKGPYYAWKGNDDLEVFFFFYQFPKVEYATLVLVSWGEIQPTRYIVNIEGIWELEGLHPEQINS